jgi:hypothetical protein
VFQFSKSAQIVIAQNEPLAEFQPTVKSKVQNSDSSERPILHEGKIKVFTAVAWFCVILGFLAIIPGVCRLVSDSHAAKSQIKLSDLSSFGSYLQGAVQSLWSLAAFLFIYVAFLGQKQQLKLQSEQFDIEQRQQQGQLEDQRQQFKIQNESIRRQDFENKFFQLLGLHHKLVEDMADDKMTGRDCFQKWYDERLYSDYHSKKNPLMLSGGVPKLTPKRELEFTIDCYDRVYQGLKGDLGHYFRNLYHIVKFVDEAQDIGDELKKKYTTLVRAQLSSYEQALLFYNCVHPYGEEFYILIERYALFHNFDDNLFLDKTHEDYYDPTAYGIPTRIKKRNPRLVKIMEAADNSSPA